MKDLWNFKSEINSVTVDHEGILHIFYQLCFSIYIQARCTSKDHDKILILFFLLSLSLIFFLSLEYPEIMLQSFMNYIISC